MTIITIIDNLTVRNAIHSIYMSLIEDGLDEILIHKDILKDWYNRLKTEEELL